MDDSALAATFDDALRACISQQFDEMEPRQAFPLDVEAAATADGPPECQYRVVLENDAGEELFARVEGEREQGGWRFTYLDYEEA